MARKDYCGTKVCLARIQAALTVPSGSFRSLVLFVLYFRTGRAFQCTDYKRLALNFSWPAFSNVKNRESIMLAQEDSGSSALQRGELEMVNREKDEE